jgi:hypothetical protein
MRKRASLWLFRFPFGQQFETGDIVKKTWQSIALTVKIFLSQRTTVAEFR